MDSIALKEVSLSKSHRSIQLHTGLDEETRERVSSNLKHILADNYLLMLKTHNYHWNVKGANFKQIHDLTEEHYKDLFNAIDDLAERIRSFGFEAPGTFSEFQELSSFNEVISGLSNLEMVADLLTSHESLIRRLRKSIKIASEAEDEVTTDILVGRLSTHEKQAGMFRSFVEK